MTSMKVTMVCENTVGTPAGLTGEWGLGMLVEIPGLTVLFDTGAQGALVPNARTLGIDLDRVDVVVLSHGHYDHTGGLPAFLRYRRRRLPVVAHPDVFTPRFIREDGGLRHIGVPFRRVELESLGADFQLGAGPRELAPGLFAGGEVPRRLSFEKGDRRLVLLDGEREKPDPLRDDLSLYAVTPRGLVIILGCAHAGVANIVTHAREVTGVERVHAIIGGTHLGAVDPAQQEATVDYLRALDVELLAANHCTGLPMAAALARVFRERFRFAPAGSRFVLPFGY
ncbi:MAG: MBL fold metallo-hydrolase [Bacillota bacterium]|nr:MBL fold metallo-hydrolase [Bacillota bacterium]